ncbi:LytR/AlgR family response regulator transcription factor [Aquimarina algiphila]|uniref:Response regulator transcription factor n=1 Tax=Aquimarina algiphila TaxID=2047982 RepID=A0A554VHL8_9FLAO|nr:LytTR family DNA-binding domain-containing protein [Aquimarina algiphila]TSE06989.1 response regulator transcription factor [Aquimarina algiphila]
MQIKVIAIDDEPEALENLKILLDEQDDYILIDSCTNGKTAIEAIIEQKPDLVFLDIQMPEISGFDVISAVRPYFAPVYVFITAYDQYAIHAFEVNAIDYLLKPFDDERFYAALHKAKKQIELKTNEDLNFKLDALLQKTNANKKAMYIKRIPVKLANRVYFLEIDKVIYLKAENQYINVFLNNGTQHLIRDTLNRLESELNPEIFFRCHRSNIVNINEIKQIEPFFSGDYIMTLKNGDKLKLSKSRKEGLKKLMNW